MYAVTSAGTFRAKVRNGTIDRRLRFQKHTEMSHNPGAFMVHNPCIGCQVPPQRDSHSISYVIFVALPDERKFDVSTGPQENMYSYSSIIECVRDHFERASGAGGRIIRSASVFVKLDSGVGRPGNF